MALIERGLLPSQAYLCLTVAWSSMAPLGPAHSPKSCCSQSQELLLDRVGCNSRSCDESAHRHSVPNREDSKMIRVRSRKNPAPQTCLVWFPLTLSPQHLEKPGPKSMIFSTSLVGQRLQFSPVQLIVKSLIPQSEYKDPSRSRFQSFPRWNICGRP